MGLSYLRHNLWRARTVCAGIAVSFLCVSSPAFAGVCAVWDYDTKGEASSFTLEMQIGDAPAYTATVDREQSRHHCAISCGRQAARDTYCYVLPCMPPAASLTVRAGNSPPSNSAGCAEGTNCACGTFVPFQSTAAPGEVKGQERLTVPSTQVPQEDVQLPPRQTFDKPVVPPAPPSVRTSDTIPALMSMPDVRIEEIPVLK